MNTHSNEAVIATHTNGQAVKPSDTPSGPPDDTQGAPAGLSGCNPNSCDCADQEPQQLVGLSRRSPGLRLYELLCENLHVGPNNHVGIVFHPWHQLTEGQQAPFENAAAKLTGPISRELNDWIETARGYARDDEHHTDQLKKIGLNLGPSVYFADDGGFSLDMLLAKVPEGVEKIVLSHYHHKNALAHIVAFLLKSGAASHYAVVTDGVLEPHKVAAVVTSVIQGHYKQMDELSKKQREIIVKHGETVTLLDEYRDTADRIANKLTSPDVPPFLRITPSAFELLVSGVIAELHENRKALTGLTQTGTYETPSYLDGQPNGVVSIPLRVWAAEEIIAEYVRVNQTASGWCIGHVADRDAFERASEFRQSIFDAIFKAGYDVRQMEPADVIRFIGERVGTAAGQNDLQVFVRKVSEILGLQGDNTNHDPEGVLGSLALALSKTRGEKDAEESISVSMFLTKVRILLKEAGRDPGIKPGHTFNHLCNIFNEHREMTLKGNGALRLNYDTMNSEVQAMAAMLFPTRNPDETPVVFDASVVRMKLGELMEKYGRQEQQIRDLFNESESLKDNLDRVGRAIHGMPDDTSEGRVRGWDIQVLLNKARSATRNEAVNERDRIKGEYDALLAEHRRVLEAIRSAMLEHGDDKFKSFSVYDVEVAVEAVKEISSRGRPKAEPGPLTPESNPTIVESGFDVETERNPADGQK